jgi:hypothetical protein
MPAITRARGWLFDVFAHNYAELMRTKRVVERKMHGLDMSDLPYPGTVSSSYNNTALPTPAPSPPVAAAPSAPPAPVTPAPAASGIVGRVLPWVLTAAMGIGGAGAAGYLLQPKPVTPAAITTPPAVTTPVQTTVVPSTTSPGFDEVTETSSDGGKTWTEIGRRHLVKQADGSYK